MEMHTNGTIDVAANTTTNRCRIVLNMLSYWNEFYLQPATKQLNLPESFARVTPNRLNGPTIDKKRLAYASAKQEAVALAAAAKNRCHVGSRRRRYGPHDALAYSPTRGNAGDSRRPSR